MKKCCFVAALLLLACCSLPASAQLEQAATTPIQLKQLIIGRLTYIGDDSSGYPGYTITLDSTIFGGITVPLAAPITFSYMSKWIVVGEAGVFGPQSFTSSFPLSTPQEILMADFPVTCPCFMVGAQLQILTSPPGQPTITISLKNGNYIKTSSTLNVFLTTLPGQQAIALQQWAPVVLKAVQ
jgi:hypothetical protein